MWLLSLFSGALLTLPVAVTVGIYVGVEWARIVQHQVGLGSVQGEGPGQIQTNTYCQKFYGIAPFPGRYVCKSVSFSPALGLLSLVGCADQVDSERCFFVTAVDPIPEIEICTIHYSFRRQYDKGFVANKFLSVVNPNQVGVGSGMGMFHRLMALLVGRYAEYWQSLHERTWKSLCRVRWCEMSHLLR